MPHQPPNRAERRPGRRALLSAAVALVGLFAARGLPAQEKGPSRGEDYRRSERIARLTASRSVRAVRVDTAPEIDGRLDETAWRDAPAATAFYQTDPNEGARATQRTEVHFLYDENALYIGARMYRDHPGDIRAFVSRRDVAGNSPRLIISLDPYLNRRTSYSFAVNAAGVRIDYYQPQDATYPRDESYDPVWEARTHIDSLGWTAEMRIPFSQLRFHGGGVQRWGMNINRWIPSLNEDDYWIFIPKTETGWASRFGILSGMRGIRSTSRMELHPYVTTQAHTSGDLSPRNPFESNPQMTSRAGANFKMGLGPSLTLDATVNPDFGQVEADPAVVNLSAYETFFEERRPFFTEGSRLLQGDGPDYFYSRRIGAPPHGDPSADFVDRPSTTTILGAGKVTGRLRSGLSVGGLAAVTGAESARTYDTLSGVRSRVPVEPLTAYGVARLQQEFGPASSTAGLSLTGVRRAISSGSPLRNSLAREAYAGGGDWRLRFAGGEYELRGHAGFSYVAGDSTAIEEIQRSSAHYYQRPDQSYVSLDPSRRSLAGWTAGLQASRNAGEHWLWSVGGSAETPGFEINDAGRLHSADDLELDGDLHYRETRPGSWYHGYSLGLHGGRSWDFGGVHTGSYVSVDADVTWPSYLETAVGVHAWPRALSDSQTRGGPLMATPSGWGADASVGNGYGSRSRLGGDLSYERDGLGGWNYQVRGSLELRPGDRWKLSVDPRYERSVSARQYLDTRSGGPASTFGQRYLFAGIERSTISAQIRLNYSFTPDLSLELYAEPFAASGRYFDFGQLPAPRRLDLVVFGRDAGSIARQPGGDYRVQEGGDSFTIGNPDFNVRSFRSNLVLRWQWRPGSTFFFVWQQNRARSTDVGRLVGPGSLWDTLGAGGDQTVAVKLSYWLPIG